MRPRVWKLVVSSSTRTRLSEVVGIHPLFVCHARLQYQPRRARKGASVQCDHEQTAGAALGPQKINGSSSPARTGQARPAAARRQPPPHSTQQASAIKPDASSKQRRGDRRFAVFGSGTCTRRLVHLRNEVGAPKPRDPLPAPSPVGVSKWKGRDWREAPGLFSQNGYG